MVHTSLAMMRVRVGSERASKQNYKCEVASECRQVPDPKRYRACRRMGFAFEQDQRSIEYRYGGRPEDSGSLLRDTRGLQLLDSDKTRPVDAIGSAFTN